LPSKSCDASSQASDAIESQSKLSIGGRWNGKIVRSPSADARKRKTNLQEKKLFLKRALCQHIDQLAEKECNNYYSMLKKNSIE
jgi:hypothetical protein